MQGEGSVLSDLSLHIYNYGVGSVKLLVYCKCSRDHAVTRRSPAIYPFVKVIFVTFVQMMQTKSVIISREGCALWRFESYPETPCESVAPLAERQAAQVSLNMWCRGFVATRAIIRIGHAIDLD